jgi:translocation and assembly module TamA
LGAGAQEPFFTKLLANNSIQIGSIVNHGDYEALKTSLQVTAEAKGYFDHHMPRKIC